MYPVSCDHGEAFVLFFPARSERKMLLESKTLHRHQWNLYWGPDFTSTILLSIITGDHS